MPMQWRGVITLVVGSLLSGYVGLASTDAFADTSADRRATTHKVAAVHADIRTTTKHSLSKTGKAHYASAGGISCVPFARAASGIALKGNAVNWWDAAAGIYQRGNRPEAGSVLNFRANGRMRLGHVAVVTNVIGDRELEIDHANWSGLGASKGGISRGVRVIDVSQNNDWTAVRVALGHSEDFGSVYSTYGFIYDRPDSGRMVANVRPGLSPVTDRAMMNEVAEAPSSAGISPASLQVDAPDHSLR
jgi:surface antigen